MKIKQIITESAYLNEFAAGDEGFGPFKVYLGDHLVDTFATFEEAEDEIEFIKDSDPRTRNELWKITDGTGETVWEHDPGAAIDAMRKAGKMQFLKPKSQDISEVKQRLDPKCWTGKHKEGTKIKGGVRVNNCVPNESIEEGEQRMSRAAKGNEKYGKDGMKALAKAGREGASEKKMDSIRDQHDNYNESIEEGETWAKHNNPRAGGMSKKSVSSYRRSHPGSKIQTAVTTKPSKLKKGSKAAARRKSFCARMKGMKKSRTSAKTARDPNSNINKSLRRWNCESVEQMQELVMLAEQLLAKHKK